jgi:hypothetical protein
MCSYIKGNESNAKPQNFFAAQAPGKICYLAPAALLSKVHQASQLFKNKRMLTQELVRLSFLMTFYD